MMNLTRPGAISSTVWIPPASTEAWRVNGLVTAGNSVSREVFAAAWPSTTKVSREIIWLSRMPAPSKPPASMLWMWRTSSGIGAVPGTRKWTRTGSLMAPSLVARLALLAERRHAFLEVRARPHPIAQRLLERLARARVLGQRGRDLLLHRLHRRRAVSGDPLGDFHGREQQPYRRHDSVDQPEPRGPLR